MLPGNKDCTLMEDGFIGSQMRTKVNGRLVHAVGTRFPSDTEVSVGQLVTFHTELEKRSKHYDGEIVIQTMVHTKELVLYVRVPSTVSETEFFSLIEDFKQALAKSDILYHPIMWPVDENLHFLFQKK